MAPGARGARSAAAAGSALLGSGGAGGVFVGLGGEVGTDGPGPVIGGGALGDAACATTTQQAKQVPLDLYVMLDSSGSMLSLV